MLAVDKELVSEFVVESQEGLAHIESQMLAIEAAGADVALDLVNAVFRTIHSIKGAAGFLGFDRIGALAHSLEELLNSLRNHELLPTSELITSMLSAADLIRNLLEAVETSNDVDVSSHILHLQHYKQGLPGRADAGALRDPLSTSDSSSLPNLSEPYQQDADRSSEASSATLEFLVECIENLDQMERGLVALERHPDDEATLRSVFRTMHTIKGGAGFLGFDALGKLAHAAEEVLGALRNGNLKFSSEIANRLLEAIDVSRTGLRLIESTGSDHDLELRSADQKLLALVGAARIDGEPLPASAPATSRPDTAGDVTETSSTSPPLALSPPDSASDKPPGGSAESTIRVDVALLDKLMTRVGELVLARNQILRHTNSAEDAVFQSTAQRLNLITTELQEGVMKTRMQPIGNVWGKFPRVVRDLSAQLGKQVRIEMAGRDTELDKTIVEAIKDPLTHIIRNSVDHGIELPEDRAAAGKSAEGRLFLHAYHEGGQVNIEISDDGAGLNIERIRRKAVERGLVPADLASRMTDREAAQTVLLPGFSTAEHVTNVSGRGVGMDVVKTNIERIGGAIDIESIPGQGMTVRIKIPLTLAIIPALVVSCCGDRYAIPQAGVLELVRLSGDQARNGIEFVHGAPVFRLRGKLLPLVYLADRLQVNVEMCDTNERPLSIVVLRINDRQFGLVVDGINDTEEIVVKPLSPQFKGLMHYAGATIMGDGTVALIIDVMGMAMSSGLVGPLNETGSTPLRTERVQANPALQTLLIVDLGDARRFALPVSMISRLESVPSAAVEHADGREVIQYRGEILPLVRLSDCLGGVAMTSPNDDIRFVVYAYEGFRCGLVVNRILDIVETEVEFKPRDDHDTLLGTVVVQEQVTDVLNLSRLARPGSRPSSAHSVSC